jgi:transcriptional regulator
MGNSNLLPGTLDMLVLKAVSLGSEHGYGLLLRIQRASREALVVEQGALYPALFRLESQGLIVAEWGVSENNRRAKFYTLSRTGKVRLAKEVSDWNRLVEAMGAVLGATRAEVLA